MADLARRLKQEFLPAETRRKLAWFKWGIAHAIAKVLVSLMKLLPTKVLVAIQENFKIARRLDLAERDVYLYVESREEYDLRLVSCRKEPETVRWIRTHLRDGDILYDVGANVGAYSLVAAKLVPGVRVYAFEPSVPSYAQLARNVILNACGDRIIPLQVALSDETRIDLFGLTSLRSGSADHMLAVGEDMDRGLPLGAVHTYPVLAYRLDDLVKLYGIAPPTHIKLDVDGAEYRVLSGGTSTLAEPRLKSVIVELDERLPGTRGVVTLLESKGFRLVSRHPHGSGGISNCIFARDHTF